MSEQNNNNHNQDDFTATYSVEDNKLRLSANYRFGEELLAKFYEHNFKCAPLQKLFFAAWTPSRADFCIEMAGSIEMEQTTLVERAEAKAERLSNLADKRSEQASSFRNAAFKISERFAFGQPILVGHHSEGKARRDKAKLQRANEKAAESLQAVDYWQERVIGVQHHANQKANPVTRANRIKKLLAELRDLQRDINHAQITLKLWTEIKNISDPDKKIKHVNHYCGAQLNTGSATPHGWYSALENEKMTHQEVIDKAIENSEKIINSVNRQRWIYHTLQRLAYETSEQGYVSKFDGKLTATIIKAFVRTHGAHKPEAKKSGDQWIISSFVDLPLHIAQGAEITLSENDVKELMQNSGYEVPAKKSRKVSNKAPSVPLINPSVEEAEELQKLWNINIAKRYAAKKHITPKIANCKETTQAVYSANSGGSYTPFETIELDASGEKVSMIWQGDERVKSGEAICKIRIFTGGADFYKAHSVVILTDKPSKKLPFDLSELAQSVAA